MKYLHRSSNHSHLSPLQWLRLVEEENRDQAQIQHHPCWRKNGVDVQRFHFIQHLLLNHLHSATRQLYNAEHERLLHTIKFSGGVYMLMNKFWNNATNINLYPTHHGYKSWFIQTVIAHVASLED